MANVQRVNITVGPTTAGGAATNYSEAIRGNITRLRYTPDGTSPLDTGGDLTITDEDSGVSIIVITNIGTVAVEFAPRMPTHSTAGAASLYAAAGQAVTDPRGIPVFGRVKVVTAAGGTSVTGGVIQVWYE